MENIPENIYKYYYKELNLLRLAFGSWDFLIKTIVFVVLLSFSGFYFGDFNGYKVVILVTLSICFLAFVEYSRYKVVKKHSKVTIKYNFLRSLHDYENIKEILFLNCINNYKLLNTEGIKYLLDNYSRKSEKHKFQSIAIWVFIIASIIQSVIDLIINGEDKDWQRIYSYFTYIEANYKMILVSLVIIIIFYIFVRVSILESFTYILNMKSNNYRTLANVLEDKFLPLMVGNLSENGDDSKIFNKIIAYNNSIQNIKREESETSRIKKSHNIIKFFNYVKHLLGLKLRGLTAHQITKHSSCGTEGKGKE